MRTKLISGLLALTTVGTLVAADSIKKDVSISCLLYDDFSFYDLRSMKTDTGIDYVVRDDKDVDV